MNQDRWRHVTDLFHRALERDEAAREPFLAEACRDDPSVRRDIEVLLAAHHAAGSFGEHPIGMPMSHLLSRGTAVGPYRIETLIGAGGMGEVYKAEDQRLQRSVAIKVLPQMGTLDPARLARFEREALILASLSHPNIAHLYGVERIAGAPAIVMEYVDGVTLGEHLEKGRLPVADTVAIMRQIALALEAAHDSGIIHRDLKPANIKIAPDGHVTVLDFGLAKAMVTSSAAPTATPAATREGVVLGSVAYMSPEQATGKAIDKRTDVWAFGCLFYELLTADRAFPGDSIADTLAAVLMREPDWARLPASTPASLRLLIERCLRKDPRQRLRDIGDARLQVEDSAKQEANLLPSVPRGNAWPLASAASVLLAAILATGATLWWTRATPVVDHVARLTLLLAPDNSLRAQGGLAISPDGLTIAVPAHSTEVRRLYLRRLNQAQPTAVSGSDYAVFPFFSPDGEWVAFGANGRLLKSRVAGGSPQSICSLQGFFQGGSWGRDGDIVFATGMPGAALWRVSAAGGTPHLLVRAADSSENFQTPERLSGSDAVLFARVRARDARIVAYVPGSEGLRTIATQGTDVRYAVTGHLLYRLDGHLMAAPFDVAAMRFLGSPTAVVDDGPAYFGQYAVSSTGTLVYLPTRATADELLWRDRAGGTVLLPLEHRTYFRPSLSPNGRRLAIWVNNPAATVPGPDIWVGDVNREPLTRLTYEERTFGTPLWTTDGRRIIFSGTRGGRSGLFSTGSDGQGDVEQLTASPDIQIADSRSADGNTVFFVEQNPRTGWDVWQLLLRSKTVKPLLHDPSNEMEPNLSPDGRWLAYQSDISGRNEVYVQAYPDLGRRAQVSVGGGQYPVWNPKGRELFFEGAPGFFAAPLLDTRTGVFGPPVRLFTPPNQYPYAVTSDGNHFLMHDDAGFISQLTVVQNWFDELKARAPIK